MAFILPAKSAIAIRDRFTNRTGISAGISIVDPENYDGLNEYKWRFDKDGYVLSKSNRKNIRMHRIIMNAPVGIEVDHKNGIRK